MSFPWEALLTMLGISFGLALLFLLICNFPVIIGALIGQILRFFKNLFGGKDDDL